MKRGEKSAKRGPGASAVAVAAALALAGCASGLGSGPLFGEMSDRVAFVGAELSLPIEVSDPNGDAIEVSFTAAVPNLCSAGRCRAGIVTEDGKSYLKWVPTLEDVGRHAFTFRARSGAESATKTITIEVRSSIGYNGLPRFLQPLGKGVTLDLATNNCFAFDIIVDDPDSPAVVISEDAPLLSGAALTETDGFASAFEWCPSPSDLFGSGFAELHLSADDGVNPPTTKDFLLVIRYPAKPDCAGDAPLVTHAPADWTSLDNIEITATVSDETGLKHPPIVYYSLTDPGEDPDVSRLAQVTMELTAGSRESGEWTATIPNPVARGDATGDTTVYYLVSAVDNDDAMGPCDHRTDAPNTGAFTLLVAPPDDPEPTTDVAACTECGADAQCGDSTNLCARMGTRGESFCLLGCSRDADCGADYLCSPSDITSIGGRKARVCLPDAGTCKPETVSSCEDDAFEENDNASLAVNATALSPGKQGSLVSCADGSTKDEDWYRLEVADISEVRIVLDGALDSDLDVMLLDDAGNTLGLAETTQSDEELIACVGPGTYFVRVYSFGFARNPYSITYSSRTTDCDVPRACEPDTFENDDGPGKARFIDWKAGVVQSDNTICGGSDDWYRIQLGAGEMFAVEATFIHRTAAEDLDFHFLDSEGVDLTPCSEADTSTCSAFQGQSLDSDEYYDFTAEQSGTYFLVVHGFAGAENHYDIRFWAP